MVGWCLILLCFMHMHLGVIMSVSRGNFSALLLNMYV